MTFLWNILLFLHILGAVAIVGGWIVSFKKPAVLSLQLIGAIAQVVTGIAMMGVAPAMDKSLNYPKLIVKLIIAVIILVCAIIGYAKTRKTGGAPTGLAHSVGGLGLINIAIATLWS